jgi:hypothetical protein
MVSAEPIIYRKRSTSREAGSAGTDLADAHGPETWRKAEVRRGTPLAISPAEEETSHE